MINYWNVDWKWKSGQIKFVRNILSEWQNELNRPHKRKDNLNYFKCKTKIKLNCEWQNCLRNKIQNNISTK